MIPESLFKCVWSHAYVVFFQCRLCVGYVYMQYLNHEQECFIRCKTRGEAERFISDKAQIGVF